MTILLAALALMVGSCVSAGAAPASGEMARARPGDIAIRQELEAARRAGTRAAYTLFIVRHRNHPLARAARRERARLATPGRR